MDALLQPAGLISLITLTVMEIVLGIDNIVFISILVGRLPEREQPRIRRLGLILALVMRLTTPLFAVFGTAYSGRDLILLAGGLFLLAKASHEIYDRLEVAHPDRLHARVASTSLLLAQIVLLDIVFSLDSVITAVGLTPHVLIMVIAMVAAVGVMLVFAGAISDFVNRHPSMKILALSFLILIGVLLIAEGTGQHISRGYAYFAMAFSLSVELLNMRLRRSQEPVTLHTPYPPASARD